MESKNPQTLWEGQLSRDDAIQLFGELDVVRAERRGVDFYVDQTASPKMHYLAFAAAMLQCWMRWKMEDPSGLRGWLSSLPEHLRGALFWWMRIPSFTRRVLKLQKAQGFWPFDQRVS